MRKFWDKPSSAGDAGNLEAPDVGTPSRQVPGCDAAGPPPSGSVDESRRATRAAAFPESFTIGNVRIRPATVLAPMAGVTDTVFRRFIKQLGGCGLIMTEFTSADGMLRDQRVRGRYLHFYEDEHPISAQLFGSNPAVLADAARMVEGLGFDLVDLNLGCPAKKVVKCNGGSGLLRDLPLIGEIFESVRAAVEIPFTVKFRAGWNDDEIVCVELARLAESCGLGAVALHARTREQGYSGNARWEWIARVKQAVKIPVIGNGDIRSPEDACAMVAQTGCDAVMIGRMAPANPWIFRQIEQYCGRMGAGVSPVEAERSAAALAVRSSPHLNRSDIHSCHSESSTAELATQGGARDLHFYDIPTEADRYQMIRTYFGMLLEEEMPGAEGKMKQFASWFTHGVPGGAALRKAIYEAKTGAQILSNVEQFFESRMQTVATEP